jgi:hypothetical protein
MIPNPNPNPPNPSRDEGEPSVPYKSVRVRCAYDMVALAYLADLPERTVE